MKKFLIVLLLILSSNCFSYAQTVYDENYQESPNYLQGKKYMENSQYSSAINEFKKALRINPNDSSSIVSLANTYNLRAVYYNNTTKNTQAAISDLKSALFFLKYFANNNPDISANESIALSEKNLSALENSLKQGLTPESRIKTAKELRVKGEFAASAFDYYQLLTNQKYKTEANIALGDIYKIFNRPEKSVNFYKTALEHNKNNAEINLKLARTYEMLNDYNSALQEYSQALNFAEDKDEVLSSLENIWLKKVDENPKNAENHANLGVVYQKQKRYDEALSEYKKSEILNPSNINTKINLGTLYQEQGKYELAIATYNEILRSQTQNTDVMLNKADCLKELKRNDEAITLYKNVLNVQPTNVNAKAKLFELLKDTMPTEEVLAMLYQNLQNGQMNADSCYEFAYELHKAGKINDAITYYIQTINLDNNKIDAYVNLSQAYRQNKDYTNSLATIKKAINIAPNNELVKKQYKLAVNELTTLYLTNAINAFQSGDYNTAINEYLKIDPPTPDSFLGVAASYQYLNNYREAIKYYKKAMELSPANSEIPFYIASLYTNINDLENAKTYIEIVLAKNPTNQKALELKKFITDKENELLLTKAINLYEEKKYNEAVEIFSNVIKSAPDNATVYYYRAMSFDALNNYDKAIADYNQTIKYAPEMIIAYYSLGVDYDLTNNYQKAKENYQKYVELSFEDNEYKKYAQTRIKEIK